MDPPLGWNRAGLDWDRVCTHFLGSAVGKESACPWRRCKRQIPSLGQEDPLEEEMATHSSIFAWEIPWTEKPGGPQSMGSQSQVWLSVNTHTLHPQVIPPCEIRVVFSEKKEKENGSWAADTRVLIIMKFHQNAWLKSTRTSKQGHYNNSFYSNF